MLEYLTLLISNNYKKAQDTMHWIQRLRLMSLLLLCVSPCNTKSIQSGKGVMESPETSGTACYVVQHT